MSLLSQLDVAALRLLIAVVDSGSISAGAQRSHLSVAAASKRISDLEARLGVALLHRRARGVTPTPAGEVFVAHARQMAGMAGAMEEDLSDYAQGIEGRVRVIANSAAIMQFLPFDLARFMQDFPRIRIDLQEQTSSEIVERLQTDRADLGIFEAGYATSGMPVRPYREDTLVLVVPAGHPLARRRQVWFEQTLDADFVGLHRGTAILARMQRSASELGRLLRLRIQVNSFDAVCRMVEGGIGIGIVPERAVDAYVKLGRVCQVQLRDAWAQRQLLLGWPLQRPPSPGTLSLIEHLSAMKKPAEAG